VPALERAVSFLEDLLKRTKPCQALAGRPAYLDALTSLAEALKAGIVPATLPRAPEARSVVSEDSPVPGYGPVRNCSGRMLYRAYGTAIRCGSVVSQFHAHTGHSPPGATGRAFAIGVVATQSPPAVARPQSG
jgi:hypothetical protein